MDSYDVIFIGYPNWWATIPMGVFTFFEEYDFSGKTIIPLENIQEKIQNWKRKIRIRHDEAANNGRE